MPLCICPVPRPRITLTSSIRYPELRLHLVRSTAWTETPCLNGSAVRTATPLLLVRDTDSSTCPVSTPFLTYFNVRLDENRETGRSYQGKDCCSHYPENYPRKVFDLKNDLPLQFVRYFISLYKPS